MNAPQPFRWRTQFAFGGILCALFAGLLVWASLRESRSERTIRDELDELISFGEPANAEDLAKRFPDPEPAGDARGFFEAAFNIASNNFIPSGVPVIEKKTSGFEPMEPEVLKQLLGSCAQRSTLTNVLPVELSDGVRFPAHWRFGFTNKSPFNYVAARHLAQAIALQLSPRQSSGTQKPRRCG